MTDKDGMVELMQLLVKRGENAKDRFLLAEMIGDDEASALALSDLDRVKSEIQKLIDANG